MADPALLTVSLEAYPYHGGAQRDKAVHHLVEGQIIYDEPKTPAQRLSQAVEVLFRDSRGQFKELTVENLGKRPVDDPFLLQKEEKDDADDDAVEKKEVEEDEVDGMMSFSEMIQLKQELSDEMGQAWNKLNAIVSLCRDLLPAEATPRPPAPPPPAPLLPPGTLGVTNVPRTTLLRPNLVHAARLAVTRNRRGVVEAQRALQAAAARMRGRADKERAFWRGVDEVRGAAKDEEREESIARRWDVGPAWTHDVGVLKADKQMAKDVMVLYAPDEADPALRLHCKATLPQANAKAWDDRLAFTLRKKRRMRISLTSDGQTTRTQLTPPSAAASANLRDILDDAQAEAFDEEIFAALQNEADQRPDLDARISVGKVTVQAGPSMELAFEMVETDDLDDSAEREDSGLTALLSCVMRLLQISIYRHRRLLEAFVSARSTPQLRKRIPAPAAPAPPGALAMIIPFLGYQTFCGQFERLLGALQEKVAAVGAALSIDWSGGGDAAGLNWDALLEGSNEREQQSDFEGSSVEITVEGRQVCSLLVARDCSVSLMLPRAIINLADTALLPAMLAAEVQSILLDMLQLRLAGKVAARIDRHRGIVANEQNMMWVIIPDERRKVQADEKRKRGLQAEGVASAAAKPQTTERYSPASGLSLLDWAAI